MTTAPTTTGTSGLDLVPVSVPGPAPDARTDVVGTVRMVHGELVVHIRPTPYQNVTSRRITPAPEVQARPHPLAGTCLTYVGPLTGAARAQHFAILARLSLPWWSPRRWWLW